METNVSKILKTASIQQLYSTLSYSGEREACILHGRYNGVFVVAVFMATLDWKQTWLLSGEDDQVEICLTIKTMKKVNSWFLRSVDKSRKLYIEEGSMPGTKESLLYEPICLQLETVQSWFIMIDSWTAIALGEGRRLIANAAREFIMGQMFCILNRAVFVQAVPLSNCTVCIEELCGLFNVNDSSF